MQVQTQVQLQSRSTDASVSANTGAIHVQVSASCKHAKVFSHYKIRKKVLKAGCFGYAAYCTSSLLNLNFQSVFSPNIDE